MNKKTILIIEDEPKIVEFIQSYIKNAGYEVVIAFNGLNGLNILNKQQIDLVLLDLMLPDMSGEVLCKTIRSNSKVPIIMITAKIDEESIIRGLSIGADDYVTKPFSPRQLIARIESLFRRTTISNQSASGNLLFGSLLINTENYSVSYDNFPIELTPNEFKLLYTLASRPNKVFTRDELIDVAFMGKYEGYTRSLDSHIKNIRRKLNQITNHNYIVTVRGIGYRFGSE